MNSCLHVRLMALLFSSVCCVFSQALSGPALGRVVELKEPCQTGPGSIASTTCRQLQVTCPALRPIAVEIRITEPVAGVPFRGPGVGGSGGDGRGFYAGEGGGRILAGDVAAMGFRVVDRSWDGGWTPPAGGLRKESC